MRLSKSASKQEEGSIMCAGTWHYKTLTFTVDCSLDKGLLVINTHTMENVKVVFEH